MSKLGEVFHRLAGIEHKKGVQMLLSTADSTTSNIIVAMSCFRHFELLPPTDNTKQQGSYGSNTCDMSLTPYICCLLLIAHHILVRCCK